MEGIANSGTPRVFISYAHEGNLSQQVKALADWLLNRGVEVITDHPYGNRAPQEGWRAWMQHNIEDVDMVLIVCSQRYKDLFEKRVQPGDKGRGVTWESAIISDELYQSYLQNTRFYPILPENGEHQHVPRILRDWNNDHRFPSGNERILSLIRDEIKIPKPCKVFQHFLPGELHNELDNRIQPNDGRELIGRECEIQRVDPYQHFWTPC